MKRGWLFAGVLGLVVLLAVTLVVVTPPTRLAGEAVAADPDGVATSALDQLAGLDDLELTGWVSTETARRLHVDIVVTDDGAQAIVSDEAGGVAEIVADGDRAAVKANAAWWLNTVPAYQQDHTDRWVKADDGVGFPVSALNALSGKEIRELVTARSGVDWTAAPSVFQDGTPAMTLTRGDTGWRVFVTPTDPPRLLGIGGPLLAEVDRVTAQPGGSAYPDVELATVPPSSDCRNRTGTKVEQTAPTIPDLPAPSVPDLDERPQLQGQVMAPGGVCMTPMCPFTVQIMNVGGGQGVGTVMITSSSGAPMTLPLNLPPGGQFSTVYNAPNPAPPSPNGRVTVPIWVQAFAQVTSLAGPDVDAGKRLNDRGVDPNNPVPGRPEAMGPGVTNIMDRLTTNAPVVANLARRDVVDQARELLGAALDAGLGTLLQQLVNSPALRYGNDPARTPLLDLFEKAAKGDERERAMALRTLRHLAELTAGRPAPPTPDTAPVHVEVVGQSLTGAAARGDAVIVDDATKHVYVKGYLKGGLKGQAAIDALYAEIEDAIDGLRGVVPPGYATVVEITMKGRESGGLASQTRAQLRDTLRDAQVNGKSFKDLLLDRNGKPVVSGLSLINSASVQPNTGGVNGAFNFDGYDLAALGQQRNPNPPAAPPTSTKPHFTPFSTAHVLEGDASDPAGKKAGGHRYGTGAPKKTEFPKNWTDQQIQQAAVDLANRAIQNRHQGNAYDGNDTTATGTTIAPLPRAWNQMAIEVTGWRITGTVNGIEMTVYLFEDGTVHSAFPTGRVADPQGVLQPYDEQTALGNPNLPYRNPPVPQTKPEAQLPGRAPEVVKEDRRPQYRRGTQEWVQRGTVGPDGGKGARVPVEVVRDKNGNHKKTTKVDPPAPPTPAPMVCPAP